MNSQPAIRAMIFSLALIAATVASAAERQRDNTAEPKVKPIVFAGDSFLHVCMSADGKWLATTGHNQVSRAGRNSAATLWNVDTGECRRVFEGHDKEVRCLAFSPDGRWLVTGSEDESAILWDATTGKRVHTFQGHHSTVSGVAISADGKRVATSSYDHATIVWDAATGKRLRVMRHLHYFDRLALSADGSRVVGCASNSGRDERAILWDTLTGEQLQVFQEEKDKNGDSAAILDVAISADGKRVATSHNNDRAILWDATAGERLKDFETDAWVACIALSADGQQLLTGGRDSVILWNTASGEKTQTFPHEKRRVYSLALSGDGKRVVTASVDASGFFEGPPVVKVWDVEPAKVRREFKRQTSPLASLAVSADGKQIIAGHWNELAMLWNSGAKPIAVRTLERTVDRVAMSANGKLAAAIHGKPAAVVLLNPATGEPLRKIYDGESETTAFVLSADGSRLLTGTRLGQAILWDTATGQRLKSYSDKGGVNFVAFSLDEKQAFVGRHRSVDVLDIDAEKKVQTLAGFKDEPNYAAPLADGKRILVSSRDSQAAIWNRESGEKLWASKLYFPSAWYVAYSRETRRVAWSDLNPSARIWDIDSDHLQAKVEGHTENLTQLAFSNSGKRLWTAATDGTIRLWNAGTGDELATLVVFHDGADWLVTTPDGRWDGTEGSMRYLVFVDRDTNQHFDDPATRQSLQRPGLLAEILEEGSMKK